MGNPPWSRRAVLVVMVAAGCAGLPLPAECQTDTYLKDRGPGVPASVFGTYIREGELLVHPFVEYVRDHNREYQPQQFGTGPDVNFRARFRSYAAQIFLGYGLTDWLAVEFEVAYINARFDKSPLDPFPTPSRIEESGIADIEGQVRARLLRESSRRPELFGYVEITPPSQTDKQLIAEPDWSFKPGIGLIKGFRWGTMTTRINAEYNNAESKFDLGEFSLEYLKRLSPDWRIFLAFEGGETGAMDEWELIPSVQWRLGRTLVLKLDSPVGLSSKANDWSPQIGLLLSLPR
jgi:hypothetical protein